MRTIIINEMMLTALSSFFMSSIADINIALNIVTIILYASNICIDSEYPVENPF